MASTSAFLTVRTEGSLLPSDLLQRIAAGDRELKGLRAEDYGLVPGEKLNEAIARSWNRLTGLWRLFRTWLDAQPASDFATGETRKRWLLPLFDELGYGALSVASGLAVEGRGYPISHLYQHAPVHLLGWRLDLDRRTAEAAGAATRSPHSLVQEFLNRSDGHLWAWLSNGRQLRLLRDNASLTRQAYVEFDLEALFDGEVYADFALLWLVAHATRVAGDKPEDCWLEQWNRHVRESGVRALDHLRDGVEQAIEALGQGFLRHPANDALRSALRSGALDKQDYYRQVLRLVYRLLFLAVAEERDLLHAPGVDAVTRERYRRNYSLARLRRLAFHRRGTRHADLWQGFRLVMGFLSADQGCPHLGLAGLGSFLWSAGAVADLATADLENVALLSAVRALAITERDGRRHAVDFKNLRSEELGSVYESLLERHPQIDTDAATFELKTAGGNERKTTGSYYTPESLVQCLLDSALEPVVAEAVKKAEGPQAAERAILLLKVCDPACGSGHFLVAAAHRLARRLAAVRTGDDEPAPEALRHALRDVIGRCLYGVDVNPMAVELCKVSLWLEAMEPGKPLTFLDAHIQCGNSLLGTTPALLAKGLPDEAFTAMEDDDKPTCTALRKRSRLEFETGQADLFSLGDNQPWLHLGNLTSELMTLEDLPDDNLAAVRDKEQRWKDVTASSSYEVTRLLADAWCAAFVWKKSPQTIAEGPQPITYHTLKLIERNPKALPKPLRDEVRRLSVIYNFFHWHIAFPWVFNARPQNSITNASADNYVGGFDVVIGNPPWGAALPERVKPAVRSALSAVRSGSLDTFAAFTQQSVEIAAQGGRVGLVLPDIILLKNYPSLRLYLLQKTRIAQIAHWGQVFSSANIDVCTIVAEKNTPSHDHAIICVSSASMHDKTAMESNIITQLAFYNNKDYRFNLSLSTKTQHMIADMASLGPRVGEIFTIREGVHSGNVRNRLFIDFQDGNSCGKLIFGRDEIRPMQLRWNGKYIQLDQSRFDRSAGDYFNLGDKSLFERDKILVRRTGDYILAAPDVHKMFCSNNFFILVPRENMDIRKLYYACGVLNSAIATFYFRTIQPRKGKLFAELKITHLEDIPIAFYCDDTAIGEGDLLAAALRDDGTREEALKAFRTRLLERIREAHPQLAYEMELENE